MYDHCAILKQEKGGKNLAILQPKIVNCNVDLLNAEFMYSAVFQKQGSLQKSFAHFQACLLTKASTVTKAVVLIMII